MRCRGGALGFMHPWSQSIGGLDCREALAVSMVAFHGDEGEVGGGS